MYTGLAHPAAAVAHTGPMQPVLEMTCMGPAQPAIAVAHTGSMEPVSDMTCMGLAQPAHNATSFRDDLNGASTTSCSFVQKSSMMMTWSIWRTTSEEISKLQFVCTILIYACSNHCLIWGWSIEFIHSSQLLLDPSLPSVTTICHFQESSQPLHWVKSELNCIMPELHQPCCHLLQCIDWISLKQCPIMGHSFLLLQCIQATSIILLFGNCSRLNLTIPLLFNFGPNWSGNSRSMEKFSVHSLSKFVSAIRPYSNRQSRNSGQVFWDIGGWFFFAASHCGLNL